MDNHTKDFIVYINENSGYMETGSTRIQGTYDSYEAACRVCRFIIEESVREFFDYDNTGDENYSLYMLYGLSPWFDPHGTGENFSAPDYARKYIGRLIELKPFMD
jgi:hypothetical protein